MIPYPSLFQAGGVILRSFDHTPEWSHSIRIHPSIVALFRMILNKEGRGLIKSRKYFFKKAYVSYYEIK